MSNSGNKNSTEKDSNGCLVIAIIVGGLTVFCFAIKAIQQLLYKLINIIDILLPFALIIVVLWFLFKKK